MSDKPETTYTLMVTVGEYGGLTHRLGFSTKEAAIKQLDLLEPKMGYRFNNDPEKARHRIVGEDGDLVVATEKVISARVVDEAAFHALTTWDRENEHKERLKHAAELEAVKKGPIFSD